MKLRPPLTQVLASLSILLTLASPSLRAADYTWNGGIGTWSTSVAYWNSPSTVAWPSSGTDNAAIFGGTAGTVTLSGSVAVNQMTFHTANYIIAGSPLTLNGATPSIITNQDVEIQANLISSNGFTWHSSSSGILGLKGNNSGLQGTINVFGNNQLNLRNLLAGSKNATWNIQSSILAYNTTQGSPTGTVELGALSGNSGAVLRTAGAAGTNGITWVIGALNTDTTFAGHVTDATFSNTPITVITKTGTGSLTLSGDSTNTGVTTVSQGTLIIGSDAVATTIAKKGVSVNSSTDTLTLTSNTFTNGDRALFTNTGNSSSLPGGLQADTTYYIINRIADTFQVSATLGGAAIDLTSSGTGVVVSEAGALGSTNSAIVVGDSSTGANAVSLLISGAHTIERAVTVNNFGTGTTLGGNSDHNSLFSGAIALAKTANLQSVTTGANAVTFSGVLSGAGGITKTGSGKVTLSGANTFTGVTTLTAGTLSVATIGNGGVAGNLGQAAATSTHIVFNGGTLQYTGANATSDRAFTINAGKTATIETANNLSLVGATTASTGALTKTGAGTLILTGVNLYTGGTTVSAGKLALGASDRLADSGAVTVNGSGTFDVGAFNEGVGAVTLTSGSITGSTGVLTGTSYAVESGTVSAILGGSGALTKSTGGTVTLSGANSYTGGTSVNAGTLALSGSNRLASNGAVSVGSGTLDLGGVGQSVGAVTLSSGTISNGILTGTSYSATNSGTVSAVLAGSGSFTKTGAGDVIFSAANTYTGNTLVSAGGLILSGSGSIAGSATVDVASGATLNTSGVAGGIYTYGSGQTLKGRGTIVGNTVIQGTLAAGNSPGILTFAGNVTLDGSNSVFEIENTGMVRGTDYDGVNVNAGGILTYDGTLTLTMTNLISNGTYDLFDFSTVSLGNFDSVVFSGLGYTGTFIENAGFWTASSNGQVFTFGLASGDLIVSAIPEPSTMLLLTGALTALVIFRRRRG